MKSFIVIGLGRFGTAVAEELHSLGHEVLAIDNNESVAQAVAETVTHTIIADAKDEAVLGSIGVRNFDSVIVCMTNIENSVMVTLMLKELGARHIVAKARSVQHSKILRLIGADRVIFPEYDMGCRLAHTLSARRALDFIELAPDFAIVELPLPQSWIGKTLAGINVRRHFAVNILAVRGGQDVVISPPADYVFRAEDVLIVAGENKTIEKLERQA
ncbi:MAG TPA: TrkA family potassium uptake protein [Candidatus Butyricicoccus stercorigallinarum]|nr:TrkA family potassium uptake protein [Candidatus Butyricicoccus stercorigallinarum]